MSSALLLVFIPVPDLVLLVESYTLHGYVLQLYNKWTDLYNWPDPLCNPEVTREIWFHHRSRIVLPWFYQRIKRMYEHLNEKCYTKGFAFRVTSDNYAHYNMQQVYPHMRTFTLLEVYTPEYPIASSVSLWHIQQFLQKVTPQTYICLSFENARCGLQPYFWHNPLFQVGQMYENILEYSDRMLELHLSVPGFEKPFVTTRAWQK